MKQLIKLKICDWCLLAFTIVVLLSGVQLEVLEGSKPEWIWIHIVVCGVFMIACVWHVWLHFKKSNWFNKFRKIKSQATRILWWVAILTFLSGIIAFLHWIATNDHGPIGGIHGKLGFLMIILVAFHAIKRYRFYLRK